MTFNKGYKFVISIDCDQVLGQKLHSDEKRDLELARRDSDTITLSGNETVDPTLASEADSTLKYILLPLGDLSAGIYSTHIQVVSGSTIGGYVIDNDGDYNYTTNDAAITTGQTQDYGFTLDVEATGFTLVIATMDNDTTISWKLDGTITNLTASSSAGSLGPADSPSSTGSPSPTDSGPSSDAQTIVSSLGLVAMLTMACSLGLAL